MNPFAAAADALFQCAMAADATFTPSVGTPYLVRVIRSDPQMMVGFGQGSRVLPGSIIEVRRSEVSQPQRGDSFIFAGGHLGFESEVFRVSADPTLDVEATTWRCECEAA